MYLSLAKVESIELEAHSGNIIKKILAVVYDASLNDWKKKMKNALEN
jgi:hypothetical protein